MVKAPKSRSEPLLIRPGARYTCFGDGLCCTNLHGLGPLTKREVKALRVISDEVVAEAGSNGFDEPMLRTRKDGGCVFLGPDRCHLHAALGAEKKPEGCRRFPLGITATPQGGRVTTRHRCPCRTLGTRPDITSDDVRPSVLDESGEVSSDREIGSKVQLEIGTWITFSQWAKIEKNLLHRLAEGEDPVKVLDAEPFPKLHKTTWNAEAKEMLRDGVDKTRFGAALAWFADSVRYLKEGKKAKTDTPLAWAESFDRAEARSPESDPDVILADWVADEIWAMEWAEEKTSSFAHARSDLATRYAIAQDIRATLEEDGARPDRAAAEAVAVVDLVGDSDWWIDIQDAMRP